jgi:hypothetical protein
MLAHDSCECIFYAQTIDVYKKQTANEFASGESPCDDEVTHSFFQDLSAAQALVDWRISDGTFAGASGARA